MEEPRILWVDLRHSINKPCIWGELSDACSIEVVDSLNDIESAVETNHYSALCFDFDQLDQSGRMLLEKTRLKLPLLPFLILTRDQSVEMVVWALRLRVWDYFIKPVDIGDLIESFACLPRPGANNRRRKGDCWTTQPSGLSESRQSQASVKTTSIAKAASYIRQHLDKKISLQVVAELCCMSKSHFSRSFKSTRGVTFQEFIAQQRMDKALALLRDSDIQITQVAFAVGFGELSNFTRTFQRHIGMSPSYYRKTMTSASVG